MKYYFAPMEGITKYIYRNAHNSNFSNIDKYFSPFIPANKSESLKTKELNDILPENNQGLHLVPQILTNNAKDFIHTAKKLEHLGYNEINLNLGCPSGTVVSKNRGAGFLSKTEELDAFLAEIYTSLSIKISVKTRIGRDQPEEFYKLIEIFNKYPMEELIIHPRIQKDFYKNKPNMTVFKDAMTLSKNPVCYNGDIFSASDYNEFITDFPEVTTVMLGRGLISNPGLIDSITYNTKLDFDKLKNFHDRIYEDYKRILFGDRNVLYRMKEIWFYMITMFPNSSKYEKRIKKSERFYDYEEAVNGLIREAKDVNKPSAYLTHKVLPGQDY
ncbi:MAG TPA: tRNA-dihydrouridine synthase family protein [Mobilitalea sp.]|nr:tRNA-dihydrouridine synthase family protein [Mobilitalea sp.]